MITKTPKKEKTGQSFYCPISKNAHSECLRTGLYFDGLAGSGPPLNTVTHGGYPYLNCAETVVYNTVLTYTV